MATNSPDVASPLTCRQLRFRGRLRDLLADLALDVGIDLALEPLRSVQLLDALTDSLFATGLNTSAAAPRALAKRGTEDRERVRAPSRFFQCSSLASQVRRAARRDYTYLPALQLQLRFSRLEDSIERE